ncbi:hypothetical protein SAMN05216436_13220 [bacterium A37T11]|nr:hypothetical protein SAMN05216436_13220 [bacterium A37T11]
MEYNTPLVFNMPNFTGKFAVEEADITPPVAIYARNWGAALTDQMTGVHRPLMMQCLAQQGEQIDSLTILICADLGWWKNAEDEKTIRKCLLTTFGLSEEKLIFCLSHTHAGPSICSNDADKPGGEYIIPFLKHLEDTAIRLISACLAKLVPGTICWEYGSCNLATNRDLWVDNAYLVGYNPAESADDTLLVGHITDLQGKSIATLVNYACHPTTLAHENNLLSPDYVGAMREVVSEQLKAPCLFLQGASGDLAPKEQYVSDAALADRHGQQLGYAVLSVLKGMLPANIGLAYDKSLISGAPLALWKRTSVKEQTFSSAQMIDIEVYLKELPSLEEIKSKWELCQDRVLKDRLWRQLNTRMVLGNEQTTKISVWAWRWGNSVIIAQANEAYSLFQTSLRAAFPNEALCIINIANGYVGYLPPANTYDRDMYAVWQTPYAEGALETLISATTAAVKQLLDT